MFDEIDRAFAGARANVSLACEYLEDLMTEYQLSNLDVNTIVARVSAIAAKIDYLKGIKFDPNAHPWVEDQ